MADTCTECGGTLIFKPNPMGAFAQNAICTQCGEVFLVIKG